MMYRSHQEIPDCLSASLSVMKKHIQLLLSPVLASYSRGIEYRYFTFRPRGLLVMPSSEYVENDELKFGFSTMDDCLWFTVSYTRTLCWLTASVRPLDSGDLGAAVRSMARRVWDKRL